MKLDVYRSCSWAEKRQVLEAFWRRGTGTPERIRAAACQYGPWAVLCLAIVAVELVALGAFLIAHSPVLAVVTLGLAAFDLWSLWWSIVRTRELRSSPATPIAA